MIETELRRPKRLSVTSRETVSTEIGKIAKITASRYEKGPLTFYAPSKLTFFKLEELIEKIIIAKLAPIPTGETKNKDITLEQYIEEKGIQHINNLKKRKPENKIFTSDLSILIEQKAMEISFEKTKNPNGY